MPQHQVNKKSPLERDKKNVFEPSIYKFRTKNFLPYYEKVLQLLNLYEDYENLFIGSEMKKKLSELNAKHSAQFGEINKKIDELKKCTERSQSMQDKLEKLNKEWFNISPEYAELSARLYKKRKLCERAFLIKNGKTLLDCWFEDCDVNINENADEEVVNQYMDFLLKIWADFFLKYRKLTG